MSNPSECPDDQIPPLCRFAEALVLPRISRAEADLTRRGADVDHAHHQIRVIYTQLQEIATAQADADRRLTRLEKLVADQTIETTRMLREIGDIKLRVDNVFKEINNVARGLSLLQESLTGIGESMSAQHAKRMRGLVWIGGLLGTVIAFAIMLYETITESSIISSLRSLLGLLP